MRGWQKGRIEGKTLLISIWTWKTFASKGNKKSASKWRPPFFRPIGRNQKKFSRNKQYDTVHKDPFACANLHFFHGLEYSYRTNIRLKSLGFKQLPALGGENYADFFVRYEFFVKRLKWKIAMDRGSYYHLVANPMSYPYLDVKIFGIKRR